MLSDIEIAQNAKMKDISEIASMLGIDAKGIEPYGHYKAKISNETIENLKDKEDGKLVLVTAVNPTPAGEGKTTVSIGLAQALNRLGKKQLLPFASRHSALFSELKAVRQAADIRRLYLWRI